MKIKKTKNNILYWLPRILGILFICFISLFSLDVFGEYKFPEILLALFMHLLPSIILLVVLIVAWKWEKIGGWIFVAMGIIFTIFFNTYESFSGFFLISFPILIIGILFLLNGRKR